MDHSLTRRGMRQRLAQVFLWVLGGRQTRDQSLQRARWQRDGAAHGLHDVETSHQRTRQAREAASHEHHERMRRYGR